MEATKGKTLFKYGEHTKGMGDGTIHTGEKLHRRSMTAKVVSTDSKYVSRGDTLYVPHFAVSDYDVDGEEFGIVTNDRLYAKRVAGQVVPINGYVLVVKCEETDIFDSAGEVLIAMTDVFKEETNWVEILDTASNCKDLNKSDIGSFCICPEKSDQLQRIEFTKTFCMHEDLIMFTTEG